MALTKDQKTAQIKLLKENLSEANSVMFAHFIGLSVAEVSEFRKKLRAEEAKMQVSKKTLLNLAAKKRDCPT